MKHNPALDKSTKQLSWLGTSQADPGKAADVRVKAWQSPTVLCVSSGSNPIELVAASVEELTSFCGHFSKAFLKHSLRNERWCRLDVGKAWDGLR